MLRRYYKAHGNLPAHLSSYDEYVPEVLVEFESRCRRRGPAPLPREEIDEDDDVGAVDDYAAEPLEHSAETGKDGAAPLRSASSVPRTRSGANLVAGVAASARGKCPAIEPQRPI